LFREPNSKTAEIGILLRKKKKPMNGRGEIAKRSYEMASTRKKKTR